MKKLFIFLFILQSALFVVSDENAGKKASLYNDGAWLKSLYADPKARNINDIVIIKVSESSTASQKAGLKTSKKSSTSMGIDKFLGIEDELKGKIFDSFDPSSMVSSSSNNSSQGEGESTRESSLSTYISARVVDKLPNGNLIIEARKEVLVNREKQIVVLRGMIRPRDLSYDNIIESTKIADVQISFTGKGPISDKTRKGWLSWLLDFIWPF